MTWGRCYALEVAGTRIGGTSDLGPRLRMEVTMEVGRPADGAFRLDNPAPGTIEAVQADRARVRLLAARGLDGPVELLAGEVIPGSVLISRDHGPVLEAQVRSAAGVLGGSVSYAWASTTADEVLDYLRMTLGLARGPWRLASNVRYVRGYVVQGSIRRYIDAVADDAGCEWSIASGALSIWPRGERVPDTMVILSPSTGLIGDASPADRHAVRATALLSPSLRPGSPVRIVADRVAGDYSCTEVRHECDSHGLAWYTHVVARPLG